MLLLNDTLTELLVLDTALAGAVPRGCTVDPAVCIGGGGAIIPPLAAVLAAITPPLLTAAGLLWAGLPLPAALGAPLLLAGAVLIFMGPTGATGGGGGGEIPPLVGFPLPAALGAAPLLAGAVLILIGPTAATTGGGGAIIPPLAAVLAAVTPAPPLLTAAGLLWAGFPLPAALGTPLLLAGAHRFF